MRQTGDEMKNRNVSIVKDTDGKKIVVIHDIVFRGKRQIKCQALLI